MTSGKGMDALIERVRNAKPDDWRVEDEIIKALGGFEILVSGIPLRGSYRTPGRKMVQWQGKDKPSAWPYFLRNDTTKARAIRRLRARAETAQPE